MEDGKREICDGDVEVARTLISANRPSEKVQAALKYRGLSAAQAQQVISEIQRGDFRSAGPHQHATRAPAGDSASLAAEGTPGTSVFARISFWLGFLGLISCPYGLRNYRELELLSVVLPFALAALVFGVVAVGSIGQSSGRLSGRGMAIGGVLLSIASLLLVFVLCQGLAGARQRVMARTLRNVAEQATNLLRAAASEGWTNPAQVFKYEAALERTISNTARSASGPVQKELEHRLAAMAQLRAMSAKLASAGQLLDQSLDFRKVQELDDLKLREQFRAEGAADLDDYARSLAGNSESADIKPFLDSQPVMASLLNTNLSILRSYADLIQDIHSKLEANWGRWQVDERGSFHFDNAKVAGVMENDFAELRALRTASAEIQKQMISYTQEQYSKVRANR